MPTAACTVPPVPQDARMFKRKKWKYLILDEAHMIKNWKSQRWQVGTCMRRALECLLGCSFGGWHASRAGPVLGWFRAGEGREGPDGGTLAWK